MLETFMLLLGCVSIALLILPLNIIISKSLILLSPAISLIYLLRKLKTILDPVKISLLVERAYPEFENRLITLLSPAGENFSNFLLQKLKNEVESIVKLVKPSKVYPMDRRLFQAGFTPIILFLALFNVFPERYTISILRLQGETPIVIPYAVLKPPYIKVFSDSTIEISLQTVNCELSTVNS